MKRQTAALAFLAAVLLAGCVVTSVHPYYTAKEVVYDPALVGSWTNTDSGEIWTFQKESAGGYLLTYVSGAKTNLTTARLFKLNEKMFLDFASADPECEVLPPPVPSHLLLRVSQLAPTVRLAPLSHDWLKSLLEKNPKALKHELIGDKPDDRRLVLTAETPDLQQFVRAHLDTEEAWKDSFELKRADGH